MQRPFQGVSYDRLDISDEVSRKEKLIETAIVRRGSPFDNLAGRRTSSIRVRVDRQYVTLTYSLWSVADNWRAET